MYTIPYLPLQALNGRQAEALTATATEVVRSGWYLRGEWTAAFEAAFARYTRRAHCVGTANGMDALTLLLMALKTREGWADGDEVIVPALTFVATAEAVERAGLTPVFADIDATFVMSPAEAARRISTRTRALLPVHLYGAAADMPALLALAQEHGLAVVEDAAQAHGLQSDAEAHGIAAAYSFYPGKNLGALGDAGAVTTNDDSLAATIRAIANYGSSRKYVFGYRGRNCRMDEVQAAVLSVKLRHLDADNARRREIATALIEGIDNPLITTPDARVWNDAVWHIFPVLCPHRDALQQHLAARGVATLIHYPIPPHRQECYAGDYLTMPQGGLPITERIHREELSLPCNQVMTDDEVQQVIAAANDFSFHQPYAHT